MLEKTFHSLNKKIIKIIKIEEEHYVQCIKQTSMLTKICIIKNIVDHI